MVYLNTVTHLRSNYTMITHPGDKPMSAWLYNPTLYQTTLITAKVKQIKNTICQEMKPNLMSIYK